MKIKPFFNQLILFLSLFLLSGFLCGTQEAGNAGKYLNDFDYFIDKLLETHPDPFSAFGNQIGFYRTKEEFKKEIKKASNHEEFTILLNRFISRLKDGHTFVSYQTGNNGKRESKKLPLRFKASTDKIFVRNSIKEFKRFIGKPLLAVNKIPVDTLLKRIKVLSPSENTAGAYYNLNRFLQSEQLLKMLAGPSDALTFTFGPAREKVDVIIPFQASISFLPETSKLETPGDNGLLYWQMIGKKKNIGYFAWNSMVSREILEQGYRDNPKYIQGNLSWAYRFLKVRRTGDIKKDIQQIPALYEQFYLLVHEMMAKKSRYLIIDLRNNSGGMTPLVKPLLYVLYGDKYLNFDFNAEYITRLSPLYLKKRGFQDINGFNNAYGGSYGIGDYMFSGFGGFNKNLSLQAKREIVKKGYSGFGAEHLKKLITGLPFRPRIIVLTSTKTFSAAFHFAYFLKRLGRTTVVGVASRQAGNSFMETTPFQLPYTRRRGSISNSMQILFKDSPDLGKILKPDFEMRWENFKEYNFDRHSEVLKAIDLIENGKIKP